MTPELIALGVTAPVSPKGWTVCPNCNDPQRKRADRSLAVNVNGSHWSVRCRKCGFQRGSE